MWMFLLSCCSCFSPEPFALLIGVQLDMHSHHYSHEIPPLSAAGLVVLLLPYLDYYYAGMLGIPLAYHNSSTKCLHIKVGHSGHIRSSSACEGQPVACSPINTPNLHLFIYYCQLVLIRTKKSAVHSAQLSIMLYNKQQLVSFMLKKKAKFVLEMVNYSLCAESVV